MGFKEILTLLKETFVAWSEDRAPRLAAALAYYALFSLTPLLIVVIAIAGLVFGQEAARGEIAARIQQMVGPESARAIEAMIANANESSSGIQATVLGIATLLLGAGGLFGQLQDALNTIWGIAPRPGRGLLGVIKDRFLSFAMVLGVGFLLLASLVVSAALAALTQLHHGPVPTQVAMGRLLDFGLSVGVITLLMAMIYKVLPDARIAWRDVWIGAALTALLFTVGKSLIGLYLGRSGVASAYGAAGSLVVLLVWVYYSAQILFFGAELTKVYAKRHGSRIVREEGAVPVTAGSRAGQGIKPEASR